MGPEESKQLSRWYQDFQIVLAAFGEVPSRSSAVLEDLCQQLVHQAEADRHLHPSVVSRIKSKWSSYTAMPAQMQHSRALRAVLESFPPAMHRCDNCSKSRLVLERPKPWERRFCGSDETLYKERTCDCKADEQHEWLRFEGPQEQAPSTELDVLAMAAEQISMEEIEHGAVDVQAQDDQSLPRGALGIKEPRGLYKRRRSGRLRPPARGVAAHLGSSETQLPVTGAVPLQRTLTKDMAGLDLATSPTKRQKGLTGSSPRALPTRSASPKSNASLTGSPDLDPCTPTRREQNLQAFAASPYSPNNDTIANLHNRFQASPGAQPPLDHNQAGLSGTSDSLDTTFARLISNVADRTTISALGRAISDPQVLQRELAKGIPPAEEEEPVKLATAAAVLRAGVDCTAYTPGRPLSRAISDPRKMQHTGSRRPAEAAAADLGIKLPGRVSLVEWQAVVRYAASLKSLDLFSVAAALPLRVAQTLPSVIPLTGIRTRDSIRMDAIIDEPLLLRLGKVDLAQKQAVEQMERHKIAVFAECLGFDLVLVPHLNTRECLHIIGLRMEKAANMGSDQLPTSVVPLQRTVSAIPAINIEQVSKKNFRSTPSRRKPIYNRLDSIPEDRE